jgi:hypothetical protein
MQRYLVIAEESPDEMQRLINNAGEEGFNLEKFSYATGAGLFYALLARDQD